MESKLADVRGKYFIRVFDQDGHEYQYNSKTRNMRAHFVMNGYPRLILCFDKKGKLLAVFKKFDGFDAGYYIPLSAYEKEERGDVIDER